MRHHSKIGNEKQAFENLEKQGLRDRQTDRPSYLDARMHLKRDRNGQNLTTEKLRFSTIMLL